MDFFSAQEHARRSSRRLILWFALAVAGIVLGVYVAAALLLHAFALDAQLESPWSVELFLVVLVGVGGLILAGSLWKIAALARDGGARVAEELGGRLIERATTHPLERRLVNVVEEMAIASGVPAPPVYVLDEERGINAFAAGLRTDEAVVAVTRGALEQLSRDELQGVIAHEFSHILNGDMRLNLRLIGVLHGILLLTLAGRSMMRGGRGSREGGAIVMAGAMLIATGYLGLLFGKLIKAGVSRQREFLADASAVQFTRNPQGIAGALARIANTGSAVRHPRAEEASHMFFGSSARFSALFATHPPIDERIRRIDPVFAARQRAEARKASASGILPEQVSGLSASGIGAAVGTVTPQDMDLAHTLIATLPEGLMDTLHTPEGARATVLTLLLAPQGPVRTQQVERIAHDLGAGTAEDCERLAGSLAALPAGERLPLVDLAVPALRELDAPARDALLALADALIAADRRTSPFEYVLRRLLASALRTAPRARSARADPATLRAHVERLLNLLAHAGHSETGAARAAFGSAARHVPFDGPWSFDPTPPRLSARELDTILDDLGATQPLFRRKLVEACAASVLHDGQVSATEMELLRAVCQALDCPLPLLAGARP